MDIAIRGAGAPFISRPLLRAHARRVIQTCGVPAGRIKIALATPRRVQMLNETMREGAKGTTDVLSFPASDAYFIADSLRRDRGWLRRRERERLGMAQDIAKMAADVFGENVDVDYVVAPGGGRRRTLRAGASSVGVDGVVGDGGVESEKEGVSDDDGDDNVDDDVDVDDFSWGPGASLPHRRATAGDKQSKAERAVDLGHVVFDVDRIRQDAKNANMELNVGYIPVLLAHSIAHLIGYDHETEEDAKQMVAEEERILTEVRHWQRTNLPAGFQAAIPSDKARSLGHLD